LNCIAPLKIASLNTTVSLQMKIQTIIIAMKDLRDYLHVL